MPCDLCIAIENATLSGNWILLAMHFLSIGSYFVNVYLEMATLRKWGTIRRDK
jgi:hypothetical protein